MNNHNPILSKNDTAKEICSRLQRAIVLLVCGACEAWMQQESRATSPLNLPQRRQGPEANHINWLVVQMGAHPVWPETAPQGIPAVSVKKIKPKIKKKKKLIQSESMAFHRMFEQNVMHK